MTETTLWNQRFITLLAVQAGCGFSDSSFRMLPKFLAQALSAGPAEIGFVVGVTTFSITVFLIPAGGMIDRYGRKPFLIAGAALMGFTAAAHCLVTELGPLLYALRILHSLGFAYSYAAGAALCVDASPKDRIGQAIGLFGLTYVMMGAVAPAIVETIVGLWSWDEAFWLSAAAAFVSVFSAFALRESPAEPTQEHVPYLRLLTRPVMARHLPVIFLVGIAFGCVFNFYQPFALSLGIERLSDFFITSALASMMCRLGLGPFVDRIGLWRVSLVSIGLYVLAVVAMTDLAQYGLGLLGFGVGCAHGLFYPAYAAIAVADADQAERGRRLALMQAALNLGAGIGGVVLGEVAAGRGYAVVFEIAAGILFLASGLIAMEAMATHRRSEAREATG